MSVSGRIRLEGQRPDDGAEEIRTLDLTWSGARNVLLALGIAGLVVATGWSLAGLDALVTSFPVDVSRRQNLVLQTQQEGLREQVFDLAGRLARDVEHGRRIARLAGSPIRVWSGPVPRLPTADAGDDAMIAWLSEEGSRLEAIGIELAAGRADRTEMVVKQASARAPLIVGWVIVGGNPGSDMADMRAASRPGAGATQR
jgi:hypothetical protein